jgi:hypothetical protein
VHVEDAMPTLLDAAPYDLGSLIWLLVIAIIVVVLVKTLASKL